MAGSSHRTLLVLGYLLYAVPASAIEALPSDKLVVEASVPRGSYFEFGFNSLWTMAGPKLIRINADDNAVTNTWISGATGEVRGIAIGEDAVWLPDTGNQHIYKFDPRSNTVVMKIFADMYGREGSIGIGEGSVWAVTENDRVLERFDPHSGAVQAKISLPSAAADVLVDYGSAWVTATLIGELYRIDPATNAIADTIRLNSIPRAMTSGEGSVWVLNDGDATVQRIDGRSGGLLATIELGHVSSIWADVTSGGGYVWVTMPGMPLAQIDPERNELVRKFVGLHKIAFIRFGAGSLWLSGSRIRPPTETPRD
jgi:virginiamycin B lyase